MANRHINNFDNLAIAIQNTNSVFLEQAKRQVNKW